MSERVSKPPRHRRSSVARRISITHALASSAITPWVHTPRRISSSPDVIFPNAPFSAAHSTPMPPSPRPPRRTPGKTPTAAHASGHRIKAIIQRPAHSTSRTRRKTGRGEERDARDDGSKDENGVAPPHDKQDKERAEREQRNEDDDNVASKQIHMRQVIDNIDKRLLKTFFAILPAGLMSYQQVINSFSTGF